MINIEELQFQRILSSPFTGEFIDSDLESEELSDEESDDDYSRKKKKRIMVNSNKRLIMNVSDTQYAAVKFVGKMIYKFQLQYTPYLENSIWDFCWTDNAVLPETLARMLSHQRINHFPGMYCLARKNYLGKNLNKMSKQFPDDYNFYPKTWMLPTDISDLRLHSGKIKYFIVKPEASCQGRGIFLTKQIESIAQEHCVVQRYIHKPLLIDGLKFDFRMYVLLAGCDPLRIYLFKEGLARFATQSYQQPHQNNLEDMFMHLTNYAINKENPDYISNQNEENMDIGHKRSISSVYEILEQQTDIDQLKSEINDLIIKTFCAVQPFLASNYTQPENYANNMCFEILGFDILIDSNYKPYLLEVNHTPSFTTDSPLDIQIKKNLIRDTIKLMNINLKVKNDQQSLKKDQLQKRVLGKKVKITSDERKLLKQQAQLDRDNYESNNLGGFEKIYPCNKSYDEYLEHSLKLYEEWTGANIRRNIKKDTTIEKEKPIKKRQMTQSITISTEQKPFQSETPKVSIKRELYKNINSKVYQNNTCQKSLTELSQQPKLEQKSFINKGQEVVSEDQKTMFIQKPRINYSARQSRPPSVYITKTNKQSDMIDLVNLKKTIVPETSHIASPSYKSFTSITRNFSINKLAKKQRNKQTELEQQKKETTTLIVPQQQSNIHSNQNHQSNPSGTFVKPKVFNLKIQSPHFKIASLPILIQQNQFFRLRYNQF